MHLCPRSRVPEASCSAVGQAWSSVAAGCPRNAPVSSAMHPTARGTQSVALGSTAAPLPPATCVAKAAPERRASSAPCPTKKSPTKPKPVAGSKAKAAEAHRVRLAKPPQWYGGRNARPSAQPDTRENAASIRFATSALSQRDRASGRTESVQEGVATSIHDSSGGRPRLEWPSPTLRIASASSGTPSKRATSNGTSMAPTAAGRANAQQSTAPATTRMTGAEAGRTDSRSALSAALRVARRK
mmetsp:Transcript_65379/g.181841  ORF Transcript_65379/g.181841 Transcript_65379/m.181841 type:complete len:243 (-) Transcript_65379:505-1233(-)